MKRIIMLVAMCFIMISISGCGGDLNAAYDDDTAIAKGGDSSRSSGASSMRIGNDLSVKATMTGAKTIWEYSTSKEVDVSLSFLLSVSEGGRAKLVLITPYDEVIILAENTDNTIVKEKQSKTVTLNPGKNRIKLVCSDAPKFELKLNVEVGELEW